MTTLTKWHSICGLLFSLTGLLIHTLPANAIEKAAAPIKFESTPTLPIDITPSGQGVYTLKNNINSKQHFTVTIQLLNNAGNFADVAVATNPVNLNDACSYSSSSQKFTIPAKGICSIELLFSGSQPTTSAETGKLIINYGNVPGETLHSQFTFTVESAMPEFNATAGPNAGNITGYVELQVKEGEKALVEKIVATDSAGVYFTDDDGATYHDITANLSRQVFSLTKYSDDTIIAGHATGASYLPNTATTWIAYRLPVTDRVTAAIVDDAGVAYFGTATHGVWRCPTRTANCANLGLSNRGVIHNFTFDAANRLFAASDLGVDYLNGNNWVNTQSPVFPAYALAYHAELAKVLVAGMPPSATVGGLFELPAIGMTWVDAGLGAGVPGFSLGIDPTGRIHVGSHLGLVYQADPIVPNITKYLFTSYAVDESKADIPALLASTLNPGYVSAGTRGNGSFESFDRGQTFVAANKGINAATSFALLGYYKDERVFSGQSVGAISYYESSDWTNTLLGIPEDVLDLDQSAFGPAIYGATGAGPFLTVDGNTWETMPIEGLPTVLSVNNLLPSYQVSNLLNTNKATQAPISVIKVNPSNQINDEVYAAPMHNTGVYKYDSINSLWFELGTTLSGAPLEAEVEDMQFIYETDLETSVLLAGTREKGIYMHDPVSDQFSTFGTGLETATITAITPNAQELYAGTEDGLYLRDLDTNAWNRIAFAGKPIVDAAADRGVLYVIAGEELYYTQDGSTFFPFNLGATTAPLQSIGFQTVDAQRLIFIGTAGTSTYSASVIPNEDEK